MFKKYVLDLDYNAFATLSMITKFEDICKGRKRAILVNCKDGFTPQVPLVPIMRTTTIYKEPAQKFLPIHYDIMDQIKKKFKEDIQFNNAMIEIYDPRYRKMGFHTDQSLDLAEDSYICIFSCYENDSNNKNDIRKLVIQNKSTKELSEILMENNSIVLFSTSVNHEHVHKIILDSNKSTNRWLGLTLRLSKTFVKFVDEVPYFYFNKMLKNKVLRIANENEKKEFLKLKGKENSEIGYIYPEIDYTISTSDMLPII